MSLKFKLSISKIILYARNSVGYVKAVCPLQVIVTFSEMEKQLALAPSSLDPSPASSSLIFLVPAGWRLLVSTHPAVAAQLVAMVEAFLLGQREALPPLVEVAQPCVDLVIVHSA